MRYDGHGDRDHDTTPVARNPERWGSCPMHEAVKSM